MIELAVGFIIGVGLCIFAGAWKASKPPNATMATLVKVAEHREERIALLKGDFLELREQNIRLQSRIEDLRKQYVYLESEYDCFKRLGEQESPPKQ